MDDSDLDNIVEQDGRIFLESDRGGKKVPLTQVFEHYEVRNLEAHETAEILGVDEPVVRQGINYLHSDKDVYSDFESGVEGFSAEDHGWNLVESMREDEPEPADPNLESVEGWEYLKRDLGDIALWNREKSTEQTAFVEPADMVFTDYYERGMDIEGIADERGLMEDQVREVVEYAEKDSENMHGLARKAYEKRKMIEDATGEQVEDMMNRALEEEDGMTHVEYSGVLGELQDFVEEEVDRRGFKIRYDPDEDQKYRDGMEMHVLVDEGSEEELYFGADEDGMFLGSTVSEAEKRVTEVEGSRAAVIQELNALALRR